MPLGQTKAPVGKTASNQQSQNNTFTNAEKLYDMHIYIHMYCIHILAYFTPPTSIRLAFLRGDRHILIKIKQISSWYPKEQLFLVVVLMT